MNNFETYLNQSLDHIKDSSVKEAMLYSLTAEGKRIRPKLLFAALEAYGINSEKGMNCATGIEMIHTYSLIHDDLPAMDNDVLRRGKPTCHVKFGEAEAILAGDGLLSEAFYYAALSSEDANINVKIVKEFVDACGSNGMILGQIKDLDAEKNPLLSTDELSLVHEYKTGKLLTLPLVCAALIAKRSDDVEKWREIGRSIGIAFQIQDDILDTISNSELLGKSTSDKENNKTTYCTLMSVEDAQKMAEQYFNHAEMLLNQMELNQSPILEIINLLKKRKK